MWLYTFVNKISKDLREVRPSTKSDQQNLEKSDHVSGEVGPY